MGKVRTLRNALRQVGSRSAKVIAALCDGHRRDFGMAEPKRLKRAASSGWLAGCCAVAVSLMLGAQAFAVVTVTVIPPTVCKVGT